MTALPAVSSTVTVERPTLATYAAVASEVMAMFLGSFPPVETKSPEVLVPVAIGVTFPGTAYRTAPTAGRLLTRHQEGPERVLRGPGSTSDTKPADEHLYPGSLRR